MAQSIHIIAPHKLTQDAAFERVLTCLQLQKVANAHVVLFSVNIQPVLHSIDIKLSAYGYPVNVVIAVSPSQVELRTSEATDAIEGLAMWWKQLDLQKQLAEILR